MQDSYEMFLLVAEELSFTKAAERAFVTQQTASYHINSLEKEFNIKLFDRKPQLTLTDAGRLFFENLKHIKAMEVSLEKQISEIRGETVGELRIGINTVRARILMPDVLTEYMKEYPKIKTVFYNNDTWALSDMLINNEIDLFVGVDVESNKGFNRLKIYDEDIYFLATRDFLRKKANLNDKLIDLYLKEGINLSKLDGLSTIRNLDGCSTTNIIDRNIKRFDMLMPKVINTSDYDIQIEFCGNSLTGAFCPTLILSRVFDHNTVKSKEKEILIFKIRGMNEKLRIDVVTSSFVPTTKYLDCFIQHFVKYNREKYLTIENRIKKKKKITLSE